MDRNSVLGIILITLVLLIWMWYNAPRVPQRGVNVQDTLKTEKHQETLNVAEAKGDTFGSYFSHLSKGIEKKILIETDLYTCVISSKGAVVEKFELKKFKTWNGYPKQLDIQNWQLFYPS
ncbi:membrane protein insertase, YidC/Oxa1 family, N-terminal domain-containing protein [Candidatus Kryptobacter tengchongensis]|nr:membrane protein insertase, YidC/Oxa1 family, N-terminal domain-containing protein [Candidatus Kryptobacter tengchongensis]